MDSGNFIQKTNRSRFFNQEVLSMKTYMANPDKLEKKWYVVDASGQTLGRLASGIAGVLRGKNTNLEFCIL